jgi:epoxyqueuosine reductase
VVCGQASIGPAHEDGTGGVAGAYGNQQDEVAFAQSLLLYGVHQSQGDGGGGGISVAVDIDEDLGIVHAEALLHRANDAQVGLVGHDEREIAAGNPITFQHLAGQFSLAAHCIFEDLLAFLMDVVHPLFHGFMRRGMQRPPAGHIEVAAARTIDVMRKIDDSFRIADRRLQEHGARAITEENTGGPILEIKDRGHYIAANNEHFLVRSGADKLRAHGESIGKARARGGEIKSPSFRSAQSILDQASGGGEKHVRSHGGYHDYVDFFGRHAFGGQEFLCGLRAEMGGGDSRVGVMPFADAGAGANPLVGGVHNFFEIGVGHYTWREVTRNGSNFSGNPLAHPVPLSHSKRPRLYAIAGRGYKPNTRPCNANQAPHSPGLFTGARLMHDPIMTPTERTQWITSRARSIGFDPCGVAAVDEATAFPENSGKVRAFEELRHLPEWLARGYAGEMKYLHDPRRANPGLVLEGARSLIVVALNYNSPQPLSTAPDADRSEQSELPRGWISRYAWGDDYHEVMQEKLKILIAEMHGQFPEPFQARSYVDTGPIVERVAAKYAGLGWLAKNTCLINSRLGSWLFLGVIVTTLALGPTLAPGQMPPANLCGSCTRCLDACPTQAFTEPYVLDARRCISYLTIELRGAIPEELRPQMGTAVIGCDICQDVCPWNRKSPVTSLAAFQPREISRSETSASGPDGLPGPNGVSKLSLLLPELEWLAGLSQREFSAIFRRSAVKRAKWPGLVRNACVALVNSGIEKDSVAYERVIRLLERLAHSDEPLIAEHAQWALARLSIEASVKCS